MLIIKKDITNITEGIIVHGVNCSNAMGSGIAKALFTKWPQVKQEYHQFMAKVPVDQRPKLLGTWHSVTIKRPKLYVINMFSQFKYGNDGKKYADQEAIFRGFYSLFGSFHFKQIEKEFCDGLDNCKIPIYAPKIGCGLGGLKWEDVSEDIKKIEVMFDRNINICEL